MVWDMLIKYYDNAEKNGAVSEEGITPIAHTKIQCTFGILIDLKGTFKMAMFINQPVLTPCTIDSEARTSGIAPHLINDNLSYVTLMQGYEERHTQYIDQLDAYVSDSDDPFAIAVLTYILNGTLIDDIAPLIEQLPAQKRANLKALNVGFGVYELCNIRSEVNNQWIDYYINALPINGICPVTGKEAHIPSKYPSNILSHARMAKLFSNKADILTDMDSLLPGYIASQKIIHTLQFLCDEKNITNRKDDPIFILGK